MTFSLGINFGLGLGGGTTGGGGPSYSANFLSDTLPAGFTFTRPTDATDVVNGVLTDYAINAARVSTYNGYLPEMSRTNSVRNGEAQGSVAGSPGTLPTNWNDVNTVGLTRTVVGAGLINGFNYVDIRLSGTPIAGTYELLFEAAAQIAAATAQRWSSSFYIGMIAGSLTGITSVNCRTSGRAAGVETEGSSQVIVPTIDPTRYSNIYLTSNVATTNIVPEMTMVVTAVPIDITLRIASCQIEQGYGATSYIRTTTVAVTRGSDTLTRSSASLPGYSATQGTMVVRATTARFFNSGNTGQGIFGFYDGAGDYFYLSKFAFSANLIALRSLDNSAQNGFLQNGTAVLTNVAFNAATAWAVNDMALSLNGGAAATSPTLPAIPTGTDLYVGLTAPGLERFCGYIAQLDYYNTRKTNAELAVLSA